MSLGEIESAGTEVVGDPLFILGCVRSGTTLVRNLLRRQPATVCPEETHYFRFGDPFRTDAHTRILMDADTLILHRQMDGLSEEQFRALHSRATTRGELMRAHVHLLARQRGLERFRWADKTPQNIYGLAMIRAEFPEARFLHLVRNPLNVVASLKLGKVLKVEDPVGACNYWREAVAIVEQFRPLLGDALLELRYEDLIEDVPGQMARILRFAGFVPARACYGPGDAHPEQEQHRWALTDAERDTVRRICGQAAAAYGYDLGESLR